MKYIIEIDKSIKRFYSVVIIIILLILGIYMISIVNIDDNKLKEEKQLILT